MSPTARLSGARRAATVASVVVLILWFAVFLRQGNINHDVFHRMALARSALSLGYVPHQDLFSYAPTRFPVVHHEWLDGIVAHFAYLAAGLHGFAALWLSVALATLVICACALRRLPAPLALASGLLAFPLVTYSLFQPLVVQSYSVLFCGILFWLLERDDLGQRGWMLLCLALTVFWTNLHGGVVMGFAVVAACAAERALDRKPWARIAALFVAMLAAVLLNPYTWHYYPYLARALAMQRPNIGQWQPDWLLHAPMPEYRIPFLIAAALFLYALAVVRPRFRGWLITALLALAAVRAHKVLPFFAVAWLFSVPPAIARTRLGALIDRLWNRFTPVAAPALAVLSGLLAVVIWTHRPWTVWIADRPEMGVIQPVHAADFLRKIGFRGNVMTFFRHGAYLSWRLHPDVKVSCDARYEAAYPDGAAERNFAVYLDHPETIQDHLRRLPQTDLILVDHRFPLAPELARLPDWRAIYSDPGFALYARVHTALAMSVTEATHTAP